MTTAHADHTKTALAGVGFGLIAHLVWGLSPIYFKAVKNVPVWELLAHRIAWSAPALLLVIYLFKKSGALRAAVADPALRRTLALTTCLIIVNWFVYMYAVVTDRILYASLGYFFGPLVSITLGRLFLGERMAVTTKIAVALAAVSVILMTIDAGAFPWISVVLPVSFGFYALQRKRAPIDPLTGLTCEVLALVPAAALFLAWAHAIAEGPYGNFGSSLSMSLLLPVAGFVTMVPLLAYTASAKRLTLTTVGFMQYLAPTGQMLLGWLVYGEEMSGLRLTAFGIVWVGLALFSVTQARQANARRVERWHRRRAPA